MVPARWRHAHGKDEAATSRRRGMTTSTLLAKRVWLVGLAAAVAASVSMSAQTTRRTRPAPKTAKPAAPAQPSPGAGPIIVVDTIKGTFEFETYPEEAPRSVEHILGLVKRNFYNGLRVHR